MRDASVVVVGAGVGGLACAVDLARRGVRVTVLEREPAVGGKLRTESVAGVDVDCGPTVFTMRPVFESLFDDAGASLQSALRLEPLDVLARHAWGDGATLDLHADPRRSEDAIGRFAGAAEAHRFAVFTARARTLHDTLAGTYMRTARPGTLEIVRALGPRGLATLLRLAPPSALWRALGRHFTDPRLRQLFARYATYVGSSPFSAPATLMLIAHVEMAGVWSLPDGMRSLAAAMAGLARRHGATIRPSATCDRIQVSRGRVSGVVLAGGESIDADAVVFNGDPAALADGRLGDACRGAVGAMPVSRRSLSALTWSMVAPTAGFGLSRHNVFFDDDYASEFDDVFGRGRLPRRPTVYVCAQDRPGAAVDGAPERLLCLVNAPARGDLQPLGTPEIESCEHRAFQLLERCGLRVARSPASMVRTTPTDFDRRYPATGGALYGQALDGWASALRRPSSASRLPGLWLAGGAVHPGPGVPMATISGRLAAADLMAHLGSTMRSSRVATCGGTSMP